MDWVQVLANVIALCSWEKYFIQTVPVSTQANLMLRGSSAVINRHPIQGGGVGKILLPVVS